VLAAAALGVAAAPPVVAQTTLRLAHSASPPNPIHVAAEKFRELTEQYSGGAVKVRIFGAGQLGGEQENVKSLQLGALQLALPAMNNVQPFSPSLGYMSLPYMFRNVEDSWKVIDAMWDQNNEWAVKEANVRILAVIDFGARELTSNKPVKSLADMKGIKFRVPPVAMMIDTYKAWGVEPVPMPVSELYQALQQGVVGGQDLPYSAMVPFKIYEVQKYVTEISWIVNNGAILVSEPAFKGLPAAQQEALVRAGRDTMRFSRDSIKQVVEQSRNELKAKGMTLLGAPADLPEWMQKAQSIWPKYYAEIGGGNADNGKAVIDKVQAIKAR